jgi:hypothetical protein
MTGEPAGDHAAATRIVVSGSMAFSTQMREIKEQLNLLDVHAVIPDDLDGGSVHRDSWSYLSSRKAMSLAQMKRIKDPKTCAILVANFDRNGYTARASLPRSALASLSERRYFCSGTSHLSASRMN